jgi:hypothetical protein
MNGIELETEELAYLLATVGAPGLVGVDDPKLAPSTAKSRDTTFSKGRKQLEAHGWVQEISGKPGEYDLNAGLFHTVAVMAAPEMVVATSHGVAEEDRQLVVHYLVREHIVELWAISEKNYFLARLPDHTVLNERMAELLGIATGAREGQFMLPESTFNKLKNLTQKGELAQAEKLLATADVNGRTGKSLLAALTSPVRGQVVVARANAGEIEAGRRAELYGEKKGAWAAVRLAADSKQLQLSPVGADDLAALVGGWLEELGRSA